MLLQLARGPADKAALVFIHPATGLLGLYQGLVNANRFPDRAVYGLQHPYYTDSLPLHSSLGDVCGLYREALLEDLLGGRRRHVYSSGGIFGLELAHQLQHVGQGAVAGFVLIDSCIGNTGRAHVFKQCTSTSVLRARAHEAPRHMRARASTAACRSPPVLLRRPMLRHVQAHRAD